MNKLLGIWVAVAFLLVPSSIISAEVSCPEGLVPASEDFKAAFKRHNPNAPVPACMDKNTGALFNGVESAKQYLIMLYKRVSGRNCCHDPVKAINGLNPRFAVCAANFLRAYENAYRTQLKLRYAFRSPAEQRKLCPRPIKNKCAAPARWDPVKKQYVGGSNHQRGLAMDINVSGSHSEYARLHAFANKNPQFGVHFPIPKSDPVHLQPRSKSDPKCVAKDFTPTLPTQADIDAASQLPDPPGAVPDEPPALQSPPEQGTGASTPAPVDTPPPSDLANPYDSVFATTTEGLPAFTDAPSWEDLYRQWLTEQDASTTPDTFTDSSVYSDDTLNTDYTAFSETDSPTQIPETQPQATPPTNPQTKAVQKELLKAYLSGELPSTAGNTRLVYTMLNGTPHNQRTAMTRLAEQLVSIRQQAANPDTSIPAEPSSFIPETTISQEPGWYKQPWETRFQRRSGEGAQDIALLEAFVNETQSSAPVSWWSIVWQRIKRWFAERF